MNRVVQAVRLYSLSNDPGLFPRRRRRRNQNALRPDGRRRSWSPRCSSAPATIRKWASRACARCSRVASPRCWSSAGIPAAQVRHAFFGLPAYGEEQPNHAAARCLARADLGHDRFTVGQRHGVWLGRITGLRRRHQHRRRQRVDWLWPAVRVFGAHAGGWGEHFSDEGIRVLDRHARVECLFAHERRPAAQEPPAHSYQWRAGIAGTTWTCAHGCTAQLPAPAANSPSCRCWYRRPRNRAMQRRGIYLPPRGLGTGADCQCVGG